MARILLVEDDTITAGSVKQWLESDHHRVEHVADGELAWEHLRINSYDLLIFDWELPGLTGLELCKKYRQNSGKSPVLMLTGKTEEHDTVQALNSGADDYVTKPFSLPILLSRVRALLRRPATYTGNVLSAGNLKMDTLKRRVFDDETEVKLKPIEYSVLEFFLRNPGRVISPDMLLQEVWDANSEASADSVYVCINRLRKKLASSDKLIQTVHGVGYQLVLPDEQ